MPLPRFSPLALLAVSIATLAGTSGSALAADEPGVGPGGGLVFPDGADIPRFLTGAEREYLKTHPLGSTVIDAVTAAPTGPVRCVAEYEPMDGILLSWKGTSGQLAIVSQMANQITNAGNADVYVVVQAGTQAAATSQISAAGALMSRVKFVVATNDTIWIRDYGPRYVYQGDCRAVIDHTYNRPRPNDDAIPSAFASFKHHAFYEHQIIHGGGNYHLDASGNSFATKLTWNENPSLTHTQIHDIWQSYQACDTTFFDPFPTSIDSTQHLDMWMEMIGDNKVMIGDWSASNPGSTQDVICNAAAVTMASRGYTVYRVPSRSIGGTHYTYTNVVMCNNIVLVPTYTNGSVSGLNAGALAAYQSALPGKTIIGIPCENIIASAGAMHCIAMHIPLHKGAAGINGLAPTAYLKNLNGGEILTPGASQSISWISDDDKLVTGVDVLLSTDGGATYPTTIAVNQTGLGSFNWTVPNVTTSQARIRVVAKDADANSGADLSNANFRINGTCAGDTNGDNVVSFGDLNSILTQFGQSSSGSAGFLAGDANGDGTVSFADLNATLTAFGTAC